MDNSDNELTAILRGAADSGALPTLREHLDAGAPRTVQAVDAYDVVFADGARYLVQTHPGGGYELHRVPGHAPAAADVLAAMRDRGLDQAEAVEYLGGETVDEAWCSPTEAARYLGKLLQRAFARQAVQQMCNDAAYGLDVIRDGTGARLISRGSLELLAQRGLPDRRGRPRKGGG